MRIFEIEERFANNKQLETERKMSKHVFFKYNSFKTMRKIFNA